MAKIAIKSEKLNQNTKKKMIFGSFLADLKIMCIFAVLIFL